MEHAPASPPPDDPTSPAPSEPLPSELAAALAGVLAQIARALWPATDATVPRFPLGQLPSAEVCVQLINDAETLAATAKANASAVEQAEAAHLRLSTMLQRAPSTPWDTMLDAVAERLRPPPAPQADALSEGERARRADRRRATDLQMAWACIGRDHAGAIDAGVLKRTQLADAVSAARGGVFLAWDAWLDALICQEPSALGWLRALIRIAQATCHVDGQANAEDGFTLAYIVDAWADASGGRRCDMSDFAIAVLSWACWALGYCPHDGPIVTWYAADEAPADSEDE